MPYSGPASALSAVGKVQTRYFQMINDHGGINGRKIKLISLDDGYSPPKAVEQTRRLVESDSAVAIFGSMGTAQSAAVQKYLNTKMCRSFSYSRPATASRIRRRARIRYPE
jgi:branched-chain amino acid transport system substrate-binding protein